MIDLHCHLLPYVDDGAHDLDEAIELLTLEAEQGVTELCLTPHLRRGMFETPDEKIRTQYERLVPIAAEKGLRLRLSREYHCDELLFEKLRDGTVIPMGKKVILTEFSARHSAEDMLKAVETIRSYGWIPMIAHAERYPAVTEALIRRLRGADALIQINADAVLGYDGRGIRRFVWGLLNAGLADVVASDAHSTTDRPPHLRRCELLIRKKLGGEQAKKLLLTDPGTIIQTGPERIRNNP